MSLALLEWKIYANFEHSMHSYADSVRVDSSGVINMMHESLFITEISILVSSCGQGYEIRGSPSAVANTWLEVKMLNQALMLRRMTMNLLG
jgi:hypothetical protein